MMPKKCSAAYIRVYEFSEDGRELSLVHKTPVEEVPLAMVSFDGRLLAAVGRTLRLYDIGLKQLLRKGETVLDLNNIVSLEVQGHRLVAADIRNSLNFLVYKPAINQFVLFADDTVQRHVTTTLMLDYETVAAGDKFGNVFLLRCSRRASRMSDEDDQGIMLKIQEPSLNSAPNKLLLVAHFYVEDVPTSLHLSSFVVGGTNAIVYTGIQGTIGAFIPFLSKQDAQFFQQLESLMRKEDASLTGRDHLVFRSYYAPNKAVIDGDLCERFAVLPAAKQESIAAELDRSPREVEKKIAELRLHSVY
jgi:splicing factor 3B subunit 3